MLKSLGSSDPLTCLSSTMLTTAMHAVALQDHQLVGANGAHVVDDATLAAAIGGTPTLYLQRPNAPHPDITSHEEVSFVPHPKTMTMAGEWEYFAAGSQHPFPYAIAELIDNSLRATRANATSRRIVVSLVTAAGAPGGLVSVWDNGCGMSLRALNEWAVMNLTMEDRGLQPQEAERPRATQGARGATKQLCSDLSYFGVGSKNAAFFMGRCITLASKSAENVLVHELQISADALEQRYQVSPDQVRRLFVFFLHGFARLKRSGAAYVTHDASEPAVLCGVDVWCGGVQVYRERIHKRLPGAPSVLQPKAAAPDIVGAWAAEETGAGGDGQPTFTRVVISDLKADILQQIRGEASENVCRQLAHLYHYYLHGPDGNVPTGASAATPPHACQTNHSCYGFSGALHTCRRRERGPAAAPGRRAPAQPRSAAADRGAGSARRRNAVGDRAAQHRR